MATALTEPTAPGTPRTAGPSRLELVALAVVLAAGLAHQYLYSTLAEDAYISLRYSAQLLAGNGFTFNVGEPGGPVEGYSNFLWVVAVAAGGLVHDNLVDVARALGAACALATLVAVWHLVRRVSGSGWAGVVAAALTAVAAPVAAYGPSGLETPAFALLVLCVLIAVHSERHALAGVLLAAATMTRPEGAVIGVVVLVWVLVVRGWRPGGRLFVAAALPVAAWTVWRVAYYGHLLPNAIAAKSGAGLGQQLETGWAYLGFFAAASWPLLVLAGGGAVLALVRGTGGVRSFTALVAATALAHIAFFTVTGGDWMPAWRFFAPDVPLLAVLAGLGIAVLPRWRPATVVATAAVTLAAANAVNVSVNHEATLDRVRLWHDQVVELSDIGTWLQRSLPPGTVIATFANGALSYEARDLQVVDLLGLTDEHIARDGFRSPESTVGHMAQDYPYVVDVRRPEVVILSSSGWYRELSCAVPDTLPGYVGVAFTPRRDRWMVVYLRADRADELTERLKDRTYRFVPCP